MLFCGGANKILPEQLQIWSISLTGLVKIEAYCVCWLFLLFSAVCTILLSSPMTLVSYCRHMMFRSAVQRVSFLPVSVRFQHKNLNLTYCVCIRCFACFTPKCFLKHLHSYEWVSVLCVSVAPHAPWLQWRVGWLFELCWQLSGVDGTVWMLNHPLGLIRVNIRALCGCKTVSFHVRQVFCQRLSS